MGVKFTNRCHPPDCNGTGRVPRPLGIGERVQGYMRCGLCRGSGNMPTSRY